MTKAKNKSLGSKKKVWKTKSMQKFPLKPLFCYFKNMGFSFIKFSTALSSIHDGKRNF
jgi:hypothetical protein